MKHNKLERMSNLIEWILLFALLATPIMTVMGSGPSCSAAATTCSRN